MEKQRQQTDKTAAEEAFQRFLTYADKAPEEFAEALYDDVEESLHQGYPRDALYDALERLAIKFQLQDREELEDGVIDVANALVGWCAPSARL